MKAVMISIHPKWVEKIASGEKTIEVRKTAPKLETPFKCFIYCTLGERFLFKEQIGVNEFTADYNMNLTIFNKKVIGEFTCDEIKNIDIPYPAWNRNYLKPVLEQSCLTYQELHDYGGSGNTVYGWHISDLKIYDKPKEISKFNNLRRPPKSWCYVEYKENENE